MLKRRVARRIDAIVRQLPGSCKQYDSHVTCPVCKRQRHVQVTYLRRFPRPRTVTTLARRASGLLRTMPDYIIIGVSKSGTTTMYQLISAHPDVLPSIVKEVYFFNIEGNYEKGKMWYRSFFPSHLHKRHLSRRHGRRILSGESTPSYMQHTMAPARVRAALPNVKMIVMLRNPVDRAYSHYHMSIRMQRESLTFEEAVAAEKARMRYYMERAVSEPEFSWYGRQYSYLGTGHYAEQLAYWFRYHDRNKFLILTLDELKADQRGVMGRVFEFLGLEPFDTGDLHPTAMIPHRFGPGLGIRNIGWQYNVGRYDTMNHDTRSMLVDYFRPHNERLQQLLDRGFDWDR